MPKPKSKGALSEPYQPTVTPPPKKAKGKKAKGKPKGGMGK